VTATAPSQHRYAYIGRDLQDLYGVDACTVGDAVRLQDFVVRGRHREPAAR
jgi:putative ABC transport system permease protein